MDALRRQIGTMHEAAGDLEKAFHEDPNVWPCKRAAGILRASADNIAFALKAWEGEAPT